MVGSLSLGRTNQVTGSIAVLSDTALGIRRVRWTVWLGLAVLALVLGQAVLYHREAPFDVALLVLVWRTRRENFPPALFGAMAGTWASAGPLAALITLAVGLAVPLLGRARVPEILAPVAGAVGGGLVFWAGHSVAGPALLLLGLSVVLGGLTVVMGVRGLVWLNSPDEAREASAVAVGGYCLAAILAGAEGIHWGWWHPGVTLGVAAVLLAAAVGGPAGGAIAGAALGLTIEVRGGMPLDWMGALVVAGFVAGTLGRHHWRLTGLGLAAGLFLYGVFLHGSLLLSGIAWSLALTAFSFAFLPEAGFVVLKAWARHLSGPDRQTVVRERVSRMATVLEHMARIFSLGDTGRERTRNPVQMVVGDVCQRCSLYRQCWEQEFYRSYRGVQDLLFRAEEGRVGPMHLDSYLATHCIKPDRLAESANHVAGRSQTEARHRQQLGEARQMARIQLQGMAGLLHDMASDLMEPHQAPERGRRLHFTVGIAKRPRAGGHVSGDTALVQELDRGRVVVGLSDGMGVGPEAAFESGTALELMQEMLKAGFSQTMAVRAVNTALLLRSSEERFATLDLALVDLFRQEAELVKVAAAPTFLKRGELVDVIRAESLPVGIIRDVEVQPMYHKVEPGDVLVMVSDGVLGPPERQGEERLKAFLRQMPVQPAEDMAETLLSLMLEQADDGRDDALVMVIRIAGNRRHGAESLGEQVVGEWRRLTPAPGRRRREPSSSAG
jgi:stage II sporulation protein E